MDFEIGLCIGVDGKVCCWWYGGLDDYCWYYDMEWGWFVFDDVWLFEKICLEGFQFGFFWLMIFRKCDVFCKVFVGFDFYIVVVFMDVDVE